MTSELVVEVVVEVVVASGDEPDADGSVGLDSRCVATGSLAPGGDDRAVVEVFVVGASVDGDVEAHVAELVVAIVAGSAAPSLHPPIARTSVAVTIEAARRRAT